MNSGGADTPGIRINLHRRFALLHAVPMFTSLPDDFLLRLAETCRIDAYPRGATLVREGDSGQEMYLVVAGWARVTTPTADGPALLSVLQSGDTFGELGVLEPGACRTATVTAITRVSLLAIDGQMIRTLAERHPAIQALLHDTREKLLLTRFLKRLGPFRWANRAQLEVFGRELQHCEVAQGTIIIREGEPYTRTYILRSGHLEVLIGSEDAMRRIAVLDPGAIVGEAAALLDAPHNATVRALSACELLLVPRKALLASLRGDRRVASEVLQLIGSRRRQRRDRASGYTRESEDVETVRGDVWSAIDPRGMPVRLLDRLRPPSPHHRTPGQLLARIHQDCRQRNQPAQGYEQLHVDMGDLIELWEERRDSRAIFLRCYWHMTGATIASLEAGRFEDPVWTRDLLRSFAQYYFNALTSYEEGAEVTPAVWQRTFDLAVAAHASVPVSLLLGINAHINRDLVFAVVDMLNDDWIALDDETRRRRESDFHRVNEVIWETARTVLVDVVARYDRFLGAASRLGGPMTDLALQAASRLLTSWRGEVWDTVLLMVHASDDGERRRLAAKVEVSSVERMSQIARLIEFRGRLL